MNDRGITVIKVHVVLKREVNNDSVAKQMVCQKIIALGIPLIDKYRVRFERYGIFTADIEPDKLISLKNLQEVEAVEVDDKKYSSS